MRKMCIVLICLFLSGCSYSPPEIVVPKYDAPQPQPQINIIDGTYSSQEGRIIISGRVFQIKTQFMTGKYLIELLSENIYEIREKEKVIRIQYFPEQQLLTLIDEKLNSYTFTRIR